jgi:hypothetical protein
MSTRPALTLAEVFGADVVYSARRSPTLHGWSPLAPGFVDFQTGHQLPVAGGITYLACAGVATPEILSLYTRAGFSIDADLHLYRNASEYLQLIARFRAAGRKMAIQRVHPVDEVPDLLGVTPVRVQQDLNNKGCMDEVVPPQWLAPRQVLDVQDLPSAERLLLDGPVVLKAATPVPNGGGHCVWICRSVPDVERARAALTEESRVVVEAWLDIERSVCVHGAILADGTVRLVGIAEEICDRERYLGNFLDAQADDVPPDVLDAVTGIMARAGTRGYRGILGIDVAFTRDGQRRVLDLNFRVNGSTAAVWLRPVLASGRTSCVMRLRGWTAPDLGTLLHAAGPAVDRGALVPLGVYDPTACEMGGVPRLHGLVVAESRAAVADEARRLAEAGLR